MSNLPASRRCIPLSQRFFCDGPYYVITSSSLGGSTLTPETIADSLASGDPARITPLLEDGICLPLSFQGDCAFDGAIVVIGDLTEQEEREWIGRIATQLKIPCGKLLILCGGGAAEDFEGAIEGSGIQGYDDYFEAIEIPPGDYLLEVYAYVSSMTVDFYFGEDDPLEEWFHRTRPGLALPKWLECFKTQGFIGSLSDELMTYLVRLAPLETALPLPALEAETGWCGDFELRRPEVCPLGILRSDYGDPN